ncbi:MAG TPA: GNAT family N-acetyltransferase [Elusimicrobiota bacterium]|jgi:ribosomal protein S18 acetylase RimI-like enzyme|nr:GNAT family N-acetyltransferase [Elusimicrobiota bacterium]
MKKTVLVRPCRSFDAGEVAEVAKRPGAARWSREAYAAEAERTDSIFLVADDGAVRGYAVARLFEDEAQLLDFAAAEDGLGTGRALWAALSGAARARGAAKLTLEVSAANSRALLFYKRAGARVVGRRPKFYNDGSDAVLMDLALA